MMYNNAAELIALLKREHLWAQKKLGQNFLVNPEVLANITRAAQLSKEDHVVEVGPGLGILTDQLAEKAGKVTTIEVDPLIIPVLKKTLQLHRNIEIIHQDALQFDLPGHPYKLVANIPYYITSPILNHFLQPKTPEQKQPSLLVLLVQKEVAEKICVPDGDHTILSLQVQAFGKPSIVCKVGKESFYPQPQVDSAVIKIETYPKPRISDFGIFFRMIKGTFSQRRKKLSNTLPHTLQLDKEKTEQLFTQASVSPDDRPQNISLEGWEALIQAYKKLSPKEY